MDSSGLPGRALLVVVSLVTWVWAVGAGGAMAEDPLYVDVVPLSSETPMDKKLSSRIVVAKPYYAVAAVNDEPLTYAVRLQWRAMQKKHDEVRQPDRSCAILVVPPGSYTVTIKGEKGEWKLNLLQYGGVTTKFDAAGRVWTARLVAEAGKSYTVDNCPPEGARPSKGGVLLFPCLKQKGRVVAMAEPAVSH